LISFIIGHFSDYYLIDYAYAMLSRASSWYDYATGSLVITPAILRTFISPLFISLLIFLFHYCHLFDWLSDYWLFVIFHIITLLILLIFAIIIIIIFIIIDRCLSYCLLLYWLHYISADAIFSSPLPSFHNIFISFSFLSTLSALLHYFHLSFTFHWFYYSSIFISPILITTSPSSTNSRHRLWLLSPTTPSISSCMTPPRHLHLLFSFSWAAFHFHY